MTLPTLSKSTEKLGVYIWGNALHTKIVNTACDKMLVAFIR